MNKFQLNFVIFWFISLIDRHFTCFVMVLHNEHNFLSLKPSCSILFNFPAESSFKNTVQWILPWFKKDTFGRTVVNFKEKTANGSEPFRFLKLNHPHRSLFCSFEVFNSYFFEFTWNFYLSPDFVTSVIDYWGPKWQRLESNRFYGHVATLQKFYYFKT